MHSNGMVAISQEIANLALDDGRQHPPGFEAFDAEPPPAPLLKSKGVVAMDITRDFLNATQNLDVGQLIKEPYFTLFESVGALEIMDQKMDSGYLEPGETMEDDYDFSQTLLPEEVIGIIDQLLSHEMAWHMGHPLAQTIFTSLYIDRILSLSPTSLEQTIFDRSESCPCDEPLLMQVLRAYCVGLVKTCFYVNSRVKSEHYYEEEDFVTHTFNRNLLENIDQSLVERLLQSTGQILSESQELQPEIQKALTDRLAFRETFLKTVETADSRTATDVKGLWLELLRIIPEIKSSAKHGLEVPASFSVKLQRKLASTVPPRPIVRVSQETSFNHLERLCRDGAAVVEVFTYHDSPSLMTFVSLFQARKPQPSVYIRTLLQHYLFGDMIVLGALSFRQVIDDDLAVTVLPAHKLLDRGNDEIELPHDPRFNMASRMEMFRSRAAKSYLDILRMTCQNRCRIRRTLCHSIVDWDNLQLDAEEIDLDLRQYTQEEPVVDDEISDGPVYSFPLSSWAYLYKLRQMEWIVQMGFELDTYQPDELATMYWYLQYIAKTRIRLLERVRGFIARSYRSARHSPDITQEKKEAFADALSFNNYLTLEASATYAFADVLSCVFVVLDRLLLVDRTPQPYSNAYLRYEVRMKPFMSIGLPELVPFDELTRLVTQPSETSTDLLNFASESTGAAKRAFETLSKLSERDTFCQGSRDSWLLNIKNCIKSCIFTGITIAAIKEVVELEGKGGNTGVKVDIPVAGKNYHDWWVVPKVKPSP